MKMKYYLLTILFFLSQPGFVYANCPDFGMFFKEVDPAKKTWQDLYRLYSDYQWCDDGAYAEGYSDFIVQSLAKYWNRFDELVSLNKKDPSFKKFILKHIDATTDPEDLDLLLKNVRQRCPATSVPFCKELEKAALSALESMEPYEK
jgi:hypothetical protein